MTEYQQRKQARIQQQHAKRKHQNGASGNNCYEDAGSGDGGAPKEGGGDSQTVDVAMEESSPKAKNAKKDDGVES